MELEAQAIIDEGVRSRLEMLPPFKASDQYIRDFRGRNRLLLRRPAMKERCPVTKEKQKELICCVQQLLEVFPHDRVINIDEINWRVAGSTYRSANSASVLGDRESFPYGQDLLRFSSQQELQPG
jgi:hypothetical protein